MGDTFNTAQEPFVERRKTGSNDLLTIVQSFTLSIQGMNQTLGYLQAALNEINKKLDYIPTENFSFFSKFFVISTGCVVIAINFESFFNNAIEPQDIAQIKAIVIKAGVKKLFFIQLKLRCAFSIDFFLSPK